MKGIALKILSYALFFNVIFLGASVWKIFDNWGVNSTPIEQSVMDQLTTKSYVEVRGGDLDYSNIYEQTLRTRKGKAELSKTYFIPVLHNGEFRYVLKQSNSPESSSGSGELVVVGLVEGEGELASDMLSEYRKTYKGSPLLVIDSTYAPKTLLEQIKTVLILLAFLGVILVVRHLIIKQRRSFGAVETA